MKPLLVALVLVLATACAKPIAQIDPELAHPYYDDFKAEIGEDPYDISASFVPSLPGNVVGECESSGNIMISLAFWETATDIQKKTLMFHELGHCVLGRDHRSDLGSDGCPLSIMYPYILSDYCVTLHYSDLIAELRGHR